MAPRVGDGDRVGRLAVVPRGGPPRQARLDKRAAQIAAGSAPSITPVPIWELAYAGGAALM